MRSTTSGFASSRRCGSGAPRTHSATMGQPWTRCEKRSGSCGVRNRRGARPCCSTPSRYGSDDEGFVALVENVKHLDGLGFTWLHGRRLTYLGEAYLLAGRLVEAKAAGERALQWSQDRKERGFEAWALRLQAEIAIHTADDTTAENLFQQALKLGSELGMRPLMAPCHAGLAKLHRRAGKTQRAQDHFATARTMYREMEMIYWLEQAARGTTDR